MAFWIDVIFLALFGLLFPYLFAPTKWSEEIEKELKRFLKYLSLAMGVLWWYGAGLLYLNVWRFDLVDNLIIALFTAIPVALALSVIFYFYSKDSAAFHWSVIGFLFILVFLVGWLLVAIVTFVGMVLGAIVTGFTRFRSTWDWVWGGGPFGLSSEEIYKYGQTYFMWNGWLNIVGLELVKADVIKSLVENPFGPYWYLTVLAILIFLSYPFIPILFARFTWKHIKKFQ